jgi:hypothetical protein
LGDSDHISFENWIQDFAAYGNVLGWSKSQMFNFMPQFLEGSAANWYRNNGRVCSSFREVLKHMKMLFGRDKEPYEYRREMENCKQDTGEKVAAYASRLRAAIAKVNGQMDPVEVGERFFAGLNATLQRALEYPRGRPLDALLEAAWNVEKLDAKITEERIAAFHMQPTGNFPVIVDGRTKAPWKNQGQNVTFVERRQSKGEVRADDGVFAIEAMRRGNERGPNGGPITKPATCSSRIRRG